MSSLSPSFVIVHKRAVFALRAEFLFLSFPKEKETKKKGDLRACALKNPPIAQNCYVQSKTIGLPLPQLRVALCRASSCFVALRRALCTGICTKREEKSRGDHWSRLRRALPRNTNSDGQNSISPCSCYVDIEILMRNRAFHT